MKSGSKALPALAGILMFLTVASADSPPPRAGGNRQGATFYVAANGNDAWSGLRAAPNRTKTDGPFATVDRAVNAARQVTTTNRAVSILLRGGTYFLPNAMVLKSQDSGLTIAAYHNEKPILSAGRKITGWKGTSVGTNKVWLAHISEADKRDFHELWVNGERATRSRHPNQGYLKIKGLPDKTTDWTQGQTRFVFNQGDLKSLSTITNAEVVAMTRWVESRLPITSIDDSNHIVSFGRKAVFQLGPGDLYYAENALEFLDEPGEWYLDESSGSLYYWPRPEQRMDTVEAIAPAMSQVVRVEGQARTNVVRNLTFRGITFAHSEWYFPPGFRGGTGKPSKKPPPAIEPGGFAQAAVGVPAAVSAEGVSDCTFDHCRFEHLGTYGLDLENGAISNRITHCEFADLGAGGIKMGGPITAAADEQTRGNEISDCAIHDGGKLFHSAVGIWVGQSPDNRITHNLIHDFFYTGISVGWTWGYGPSVASNNLIAFNHVHHIGIKSDGDGPILSDMGGIYTLGMQPGTKILNNLWHDIGAVQYGGWGIYLDEGSSSVLVMSNVVYRTTHGGFHQHYGATNMLWNNIFAFARDQQLQRTRPEPHPSFSFRTNIVYFDSGSLLGGNWSGDLYDMNWNCYFDTRLGTNSASMTFAGAKFDEWRKRGHDTNSIVADPQFVSPKQADFRLAPGSPARKLGFHQIDLSRVGPRRK